MSKRSIAMANLSKPGAKVDPADLIPLREWGHHLYHIKDLLVNERIFFPGYTEVAAAIRTLNRLYVLDITVPEQKREMLTNALVRVKEAREALGIAEKEITNALVPLQLKDLSKDEINALPDSLGFLHDIVTAVIFLNLYVHDDVKTTLSWADFEVHQAIGLLESAAEAIAIAQQGEQDDNTRDNYESVTKSE